MVGRGRTAGEGRGTGAGRPAAVVVWLAAAALVLLLAGCGRAPAPAAGGASEPAGPPPKVRFGLLTIVDSLPFFVAEARGYFAEAGVQVELVVFRSAVERDAALTAGQIDGHLGDVVSSVSLRNAGHPVKIASISLGMTPEEGPIAVLAAPNSGITSVEQLKGVEVAISTNSMIEYVVENLLLAQGFRPDEIRTVVIAQIPARYQALISGQVKAAGLPDPLASLAEANGAVRVIDDTRGTNLSQSVLLVREDSLRDKGEALARTFRAYARAVDDINADPDAYRGLLTEKGALPAAIAGVFPMTPFPRPQLPARADVERVLEWMKAKGYITSQVTYDALVTDVLTGSGSGGY